MPWAARKYVFEQHYQLSIGQVWEILSQTDQLNRNIGLSSIVVGPAEFSAQGLFRAVRMKALGLVNVEWKESPFEWVKEQYYQVSREYSSGPIRSFIGGVELSSDHNFEGQEGTTVRLFGEFTPSNVLGLIVIPTFAVRSLKLTLTYLNNYLAHLEKNKLTSARHSTIPVHSPSKREQDQLNELFIQLRRSHRDEHAVGLLYRHLVERGDHEVVDMRPYSLADDWGIEREEALKLFLYSTKIGILNLSWNLICPNCRVAKEQTSSLIQLDNQIHCDFCGVDYKANFDRYVELCFTIHPNIRKAEKNVYCIGGPAITPHVYVQKQIAKGEQAVINLERVHEQMRLRVLRYNSVLELKQHFPHAVDMEEKSSTVKSEESPTLIFKDGWSQDEVNFNGTTFTIQCRNESDSPIVVVLEKCGWDDVTVTAAKVTSMKEFRQLFSSEVLAPGNQVGVENVAFLFTDLLGSTVFYEEVGDAQAYGQVRRHFEFMLYWIEHNGGALVKTIGDAVMAVFEAPEQAIQAGFDIQSRVHEFNANSLPLEPIIIKIGVHFGHAIAVNSNGVLDYFGRNVNIAARVQSLSNGGDIVLSHECTERPSVIQLIERYHAKSEVFTTALKGFQETHQLSRIWVPRAQTLTVESEEKAI
jgi:adenylate cyclase